MWLFIQITIIAKDYKNKIIMISKSVQLTWGFQMIEILKLFVYFFNRIYF